MEKGDADGNDEISLEEFVQLISNDLSTFTLDVKDGGAANGDGDGGGEDAKAAEGEDERHV